MGTAFIHIPKTAGTSVSAALYGEGVRHRTWEDLRAMDPEGFARWLTLAVVREPIDRFLSAYDYLMRGGRTEFDVAFRRRFLRGRPSITTFIAEHLHPPRQRAQILAWLHFRPQCDYVATPAGRIMVRRLIPFDRLDDVLPAWLPASTPLPRLNVTRGSRTPRAALSANDTDLLVQIYRDDAALFHLAHAAGGADVYGRSLSSAVAPEAAMAAST
jgi:hypothetical protein